MNDEGNTFIVVEIMDILAPFFFLIVTAQWTKGEMIMIITVIMIIVYVYDDVPLSINNYNHH